NHTSWRSRLSLSNLSQFTSDCNPSHRCSTSAPSIFGQVSTWKAYEESMPSNCSPKNSGEYAVRHNPPPYYTTLSGCGSFDVPYPQLASDLSAGTLPAFSFVTPNLIDDMHDGTIAQGDTWLATNLPTILNSSAYQGGHVVLLLTWDEGEGGTATDCATNTTDIGCHVATIVVSPSTAAGSRSPSTCTIRRGPRDSGATDRISSRISSPISSSRSRSASRSRSMTWRCSPSIVRTSSRAAPRIASIRA